MRHGRVIDVHDEVQIPDYAPYTCFAEDAYIVGKVLWTIRRV